MNLAARSVVVMNRMTDRKRKQHFRRVLKALPDRLGAGARVGHSLSIGPARVRIQVGEGWSAGYYMKVAFNHRIETNIKVWPLRKDGKFSYEKVAAHLVKHLESFHEEEGRREEGAKVAAARIEHLQAALRDGPRLSGLNLELDLEAETGTETGVLDVEVSCKEDNFEGPVRASLIYDKDGFSGSIAFDDISVEQLTALLVVLRIDQLNILDHITLADDSILGPIINQLHAASDGA